MRKLIIFLLSLAILFPCNGSISGFVPAVSESEGTLVGLEIFLKDGSGSTYTSIDPFIGITAQESIRTAVKNAYSYAGKERGNCDVLISFPSSDTEFIDGPSAGASIATHLFALLEDKEIREDTIITGGIDEYGFLFPVGGIYEKSLTSIQNGYTYLIVPQISIEEKILLSGLKKDYNFSIIELQNFNDVISFAVFGEEKEETLFFIPSEEPPEIENYPFQEEELEKFRPVVEDMLSFQEDALDKMIIPEGFDSLNEYYLSLANNTRTINEKGYLFTAANRAFLDYISISTISNINSLDTSSLNKKKTEVENCLGELPEVEKTKENFEWVVSSELREYWAKDKLESIDVDKEMLMEEKYLAFNDLMYADAWCKVSYSLREIAQINSSGSKIEEAIWEPYAKELITEAEESEPETDYFEEENSHLRSAKKLYEDGKYGAAIYDARYVLELNTIDSGNLTEEELNLTITEFSNAQPSSLWGKIYHTQGYYLSHGSSPSLASAYEIYNYAFGLDESTQYMKDLIELNSEEKDEKNICTLAFLLPPLSILMLHILVAHAKPFKS